MDVESRLSAFRRNRKNKETLDEVKNFIATPFTLFRNRMRTAFAHPAGEAEACGEEVKTYRSAFARRQERYDPCGEEVRKCRSAFRRELMRREALGEVRKHEPCGEEVKTYQSPFTPQQKRREVLGVIRKYEPTQFNLLRKDIRATLARPVEKKDSTREIKRHELQVTEKEAEAEPLLEEEDDDVYSSVDDSSSEGDDGTEVNNSLMGLSGFPKYLAYFVLWVIPYLLLIKAGFGAVYFCVTALLFVYYNTRTGPKLRNEPSAYSVFNKGCAPIDGAVSSEQLEKQLRSGMLS